MTEGRAYVGLALALILGFPPVAAVPFDPHPGVLQAANQGQCFGYNGVDDSTIPRVLSSLRIAVVQPILTSTPYSQYSTGSFYAFYAKEKGATGNITTNLNLLSTDIASGYRFNSGWGLSYGFYKFLTSQTSKNCGLVIGTNVQVLNDLNVSQGALFDPGNQAPRFDALILPFSEYETSQEYAAFENFVAAGGTLVVFAHSTEYPVTYNATTHMETLVYGHGFAYNGKYAYPIPCASETYLYTCPWAKNNTNWEGSNTCMSSCFHTYKFNGSAVNQADAIGKALYNEFGSPVFKSYLSHEENRITNWTATSISSVFVNDSTNLIASYSHHYKNGVVVCMSVFGDDIIATDTSAQYFLLLGLVTGKTGLQAASSSPTSTISTSTRNISVTTPITTKSVVQNLSSTVSQAPASPSFPVTGFAIAGGAAAILIVVGRMVRRRR